MKHDIMLETLPLCDIIPRVCGTEDCVPGHNFGPHYRDFTLLHYVVSGSGIYHSPRGSYKVSAGQIFIIRENEMTTYTADPVTPWTYIWIGFSGNVQIQDFVESDVLDVRECLHLFKEFMDCEKISNGREWYLCGKIYALLFHFKSLNTPAKTSGAQYVDMAENFIRSNYMQEIKVSTLAGYLNLDRGYFSVIFKRHTGKTPQQYIVGLRLQKAAELIAVYNVSPGEAARQTGYPDVYNFSRMFHRVYGVAPSKYKSGLKQELPES